MSEPPLDFYGGPFSNFADSEFVAYGEFGLRAWRTVEHWFQAHKATNQEDYDAIANAPTPRMAKELGRQIALRSDWEEVKYDTMLIGLHMKFQIPEYRDKLLLTGARELREDSPTDFVWGYRNGGQNLLGKALMEVRGELRRKEKFQW